MSPVGFTVMSVIILFMAVWFSDRNRVSSEFSCRSATYWIGMVCWVRYALVGPCAKASDVAATDAVVAREITRLRKKERENNTIFTSQQVQPLCAWTSARQRVPRYLSWKTRPKKLPTQIRHREWLKHGD